MFVEDKCKSCILWHKIWKENGSPSSGVLYELRSTLSQYHYAMRHVQKNKNSIMAKKLGDSMANGCNSNFWNTVKKMNGKTT